MAVKKGDLVKVIAGDKRWKGKTGRVLAVLPGQHRVQVEGVRPIKRHLKPLRNPRQPDGGIIVDLGSIDTSNVMLMSEGLGRPVRTGAAYNDDGKKVRVARGRGVKAEPV